jgi:adenylate cyclase
MERRLAAIVAADMVGYSRLMETDEEGTIARQKAHRADLIDPTIALYRGRIVKTMGDGLLIEFNSVVDAVRCAVAIQEAMAEREADVAAEARIAYRVGVNLGDIVIDDDDILGDGVNVAARLEALAEPNGICISDIVYQSIKSKLDLGFDDLGEQRVKNLAEPVRVHRIRIDGEKALPPSDQAAPAALEHPDKPSIAILPFDNLSSDPEQEFFADGIVEDLTTALSRFPWLFVIARNSSFSYKGKNVPIKQVANDLGVRYVVEGSVRSSSSRLRVSVQLIDAASDQHVWAENYDRPVGDLFDLQDEITRSITGVLIPALSTAERDRSLRANHPDLDAWQAYQKGLAHFYRPYSDADHAEARRLFDRSVELDPGFSDAHAMIALMGIYALDSGQSSYNKSAAEIFDEADRAARLAVQHGDGNAVAHLALGRVYGLRMDFESGIAECEMAVRLNPNLAMAHHELGFILVFAGRYEEASSSFDQAINLSPNDPTRWNFYLMKGIALYGMEKFEEALVYVKEAARLRPTAFWPHVNRSACLSALGRMEEARAALADALERKPDLSVGFFAQWNERFSNPPNHLRRWMDDLLKVGLPK